MQTATNTADGPADSIGALCRMSRQVAETEQGFALDTMVGLPAGFCDAWERLGPAERAACQHTLENAGQAGQVTPTLAQACGAAIGEATGLGADKFAACVLDTSDVPAAECSRALRPLLVLGDNEKAMVQVQRSVVQRNVRALDPLAPNDVERIKTIVHKPAPTLDDVFALTRLCGWHEGTPQNIAANQVLAERFLLEVPLEDAGGYDRRMCTAANADCAQIASVQQMCHAVQHKFATNAMRLKVEESGGRQNLLPGQQLAAERLVYPDPYGITFLDIAYRCSEGTQNDARRQEDVVQVLMSSRMQDVIGNADICGRVQRTTSTLQPMSESASQLAAMAAQAN
jgi:hypothetical protein